MANKPFGKPAANEETFEIPMPDASGGVIIPNGKYEMRVTDFSAGTAKSSGNKQWILDAVVTSGEHAGQDFRVFLSHSPAAAWKIAEALRALGFKQKTGEQVKFGKKDVVGRRFIGDVEEDTYNGNTRSVIKNMSEHPKGPFAKGSLKSAAASNDEEDEDFEDEEEETLPVHSKKTSSKKTTKKADPIEEEEEDLDYEDDADEEEDLDEDDLDEDFDDDDDDIDDDDDADEEEDFDDDDDDIDDDDEEDEPVKKAPAKKAAAPVKKAPAKKAAAPVKKAPATTKKAPAKRR